MLQWKRNLKPITMLQKLKQILVTIGCLASYVVIPALIVAVIVILFSLIYAAWSLAFIWLSRL